MDDLKFDQAKRVVLQATGAGLSDAARLLLQESNRRVPKDQGDLERSGKASQGGLEAAVSYDTPYAVDAHEDMNNHHDDGQAKFLESAGNALRSELAKAVAARIRAQLGT